jgi:hypothetical protein
MSKFAPHVPESLINAVSLILGEAKVEPDAPDAAAVARRKALQAIKDRQEDEKAEKGEDKPKNASTKVAGHQYGGAKQKHEPEIEEELKGNQHKIDANKNGKIDSHDFKLLRGKKKANEDIELDEALPPGVTPPPKYTSKPKVTGVPRDSMKTKQVGITTTSHGTPAPITKRVAEEAEQVDERELSPAEADKKEKYVKSMKKGLAGFKARYGSKAKNVMYATATKMAKNEETVNEGIVNHADIAKELVKKHGKDVSMDHIDDYIDGADDAHKVDKREVLHHIKLLQDMKYEGYYKNIDIENQEKAEKAKKDSPFTPDKPHAPIATAGKRGYGPSAAKHLAKLGMKGLNKEEAVVEGTGGPIYTKPLVKLGDLLARAKDMRNIKQATIVTPKSENEVVLKKEETEQVDETMMGKAGCTSEDDKKKAEKPVDYDKPTFLRKVNDWRKSNPKFQPKKLPMSKAAGALAAEEFVSEAHFMEIPSDVKKEIKKHIDNDDHDAARSTAVKAGYWAHFNHLVSAAAHSSHMDHDTHHTDIKQLHPYMSDYLSDKKTNESVELDESAGDKLLRAANEYKQSSPEYHKRMIKYHDHMVDVHYDNKQKRSEHEENIRHHESELTKLKEEVEQLDEVGDTKAGREKLAKVANRAVGDTTKDKSRLIKKIDKKLYSNPDLRYKSKTEEVSIDETATLDKYIRSMGYDPQHLDKNKKVMFAKTNAYKTFASSQKTEGLYDGGQKGTQDIDTHMSPGATARG